MKVFSLAVYADDELRVDLFLTREAAEVGFVRYLHENYQDSDLPDDYDVAEICEFIAVAGESLVWSITEHNSFA